MEASTEMDYQKLLKISDAWLKYAILLNLDHKPDDFIAIQNMALADDRIRRYLSDITSFHDNLVTNHKNPDLPIHKLLFLLDLGFNTDVPEISEAIQQILKYKDENGVYMSKTNIPKHFGGTGEDVFSWCLCDAPLLLLALLKASVNYNQLIKPGVDYLASLWQKNGFPCTVSPELGKFRGPGKKDDCCPYATLIMTDLLSYIPEYRNSQVAISSVNSLLSLWENSLNQHPYMFFMGTDFRKLKAPSIWYDIVSVTGVLSKYSFVQKDKRFIEMVEVIEGKKDKDGLFTPESVYQKLKDWDFGQKKSPSPYLTYLCYQIFERSNYAF